MTALVAAGLSLLMIGTALLSGVFGMAGGLILVGVLVVIMPLPQAMVLHAVTQMASNGWRALLWRQHIAWKTAFASFAGSLISLGLWSIWLYVPDKAVALLLLGCSPFIVRAIPDSVMPRTLGPSQMLGGSVVCMMLMLVTGVTGPLLDNSGSVEPWFLAIAVASSMIGTSLGKLLLEKLSDKQFRAWSNRIITVIAGYYVGY